MADAHELSRLTCEIVVKRKPVRVIEPNARLIVLDVLAYRGCRSAYNLKEDISDAEFNGDAWPLSDIFNNPGEPTRILVVHPTNVNTLVPEFDTVYVPIYIKDAGPDPLNRSSIYVALHVHEVPTMEIPEGWEETPSFIGNGDGTFSTSTGSLLGWMSRSDVHNQRTIFREFIHGVLRFSVYRQMFLYRGPVRAAGEYYDRENPDHLIQMAGTDDLHRIPALKGHVTSEVRQTATYVLSKEAPKDSLALPSGRWDITKSTHPQWLGYLYFALLDAREAKAYDLLSAATVMSTNIRAESMMAMLDSSSPNGVDIYGSLKGAEVSKKLSYNGPPTSPYSAVWGTQSRPWTRDVHGNSDVLLTAGDVISRVYHADQAAGDVLDGEGGDLTKEFLKTISEHDRRLLLDGSQTASLNVYGESGKSVVTARFSRSLKAAHQMSGEAFLTKHPMNEKTKWQSLCLTLIRDSIVMLGPDVTAGGRVSIFRCFVAAVACLETAARRSNTASAADMPSKAYVLDLAYLYYNGVCDRETLHGMGNLSSGQDSNEIRKDVRIKFETLERESRMAVEGREEDPLLFASRTFDTLLMAADEHRQGENHKELGSSLASGGPLMGGGGASQSNMSSSGDAVATPPVTQVPPKSGTADGDTAPKVLGLDARNSGFSIALECIPSDEMWGVQDGTFCEAVGGFAGEPSVARGMWPVSDRVDAKDVSAKMAGMGIPAAKRDCSTLLTHNPRIAYYDYCADYITVRHRLPHIRGLLFSQSVPLWFMMMCVTTLDMPVVFSNL